MMLQPGARKAQARFRAWMFDDALPVWSTTGRDEPGLGFREHMTLAGIPADVPFKRMRVQARQIYVFSHAHLLGFPAGADLAADAYRFIVANGKRADGAWVRCMGRRGGVLDPAADLYDLAFVLFALAWFARATGDPTPFAEARQTIAWIRANMAVPGGGYHNALPVEPGHRQQNPHMHLLEAALALYEASHDSYFAELAHELVALFRSHLHHPASGTLGEFYDDLLQPAPAEAGTHVEPGHQYEWAWLLDRYAKLFGVSLQTEIDQLYRFAETYGRDPTGAAVLDVLHRDGTVRHASSRLWPQTEALKAHAAMLRHGADASPRIETGLNHLMDQHLAHSPRGMWREHFASVGGENIADKIPASSLYHLFMAFAELEGLAAPPTA
ncbi:AGE family epimerase/isomerase [Acidisphaera sp. L21]|uniref:AGE family epimerase/isomerase n=1 Tax=Acidisphaera sp. L21 TaxID=1641851 RepID=UPI00131BDB16|nr:AGE family epimerase/isomerase [Acidisphaera sp. L21]